MNERAATTKILGFGRISNAMQIGSFSLEARYRGVFPAFSSIAYLYFAHIQQDDPFIPWHEMEHVHTNLGTDFRRYTDAGHFQDSEFPVLHDLVMEKILSS